RRRARRRRTAVRSVRAEAEVLAGRTVNFTTYGLTRPRSAAHYRSPQGSARTNRSLKEPFAQEEPMKITANGISMNYTFDGPANGPVVRMRPCLATDLGMWGPTLSALTSRFRVLRYETRGHGQTEAPRGAYTLEQLADDALALLRALGIQR